MKEFAIMAMYFIAQVSIFGMAAWLLYSRVPGAGWFLLVVALVALGASIKTGDSKDCDKEKVTSNAK